MAVGVSTSIRQAGIDSAGAQRSTSTYLLEVKWLLKRHQAVSSLATKRLIFFSATCHAVAHERHLFIVDLLMFLFE